jgi:cell division transport system permease protein
MSQRTGSKTTYRYNREDFMTFWAKPLQNSYDIHLKADFVEKDSIARIENNCEQIP